MNSAEDGKKPSKAPKARVLRPLGYLERFEAAMQSLDIYRSSMLMCRFGVPTTLLGPEAQTAVQRKVESTIARIVLEHPFLRVGLHGEHDRKPIFTELSAVDFSKHIEWRYVGGDVDYEAEIVAVIKSRLNVSVPQPETAPLWRILVLSVEGGSFLDVMFEWAHAAIDGTSAKILHEDLLRHLNEADGTAPAPEEFNPETRILTIPPSRRRDLLPPLHALCRFPITPGYALATLWREFKPAVFHTAAETDLCASWTPIRRGAYASSYRQFSVDARTLQNLVAACRAHGTTLTGLLQALGNASLATRLRPEEARALAASTIVNLRPLMAGALSKKGKKVVAERGVDVKRTMGNYVTTVAHAFDREWVAKVRAAAADSAAQGGGQGNGEEGGEAKEKAKDDNAAKDESERRIRALEPLIWPAAKQVRADLQKRLADTKNDQMGLMKFIPDYRALMKDWLSKPRARALDISNLGVIDGGLIPIPSCTDENGNTTETKNKWTIDRAVFPISSQVHGSALAISTTSAKGGDLYVSCCWDGNSADEALAEGFVADLESWLRFLGREQA